jgi:uncharacterized damage-inducible protein DinB
LKKLAIENSKVNVLTQAYLSTLQDRDLDLGIVVKFPDGVLLERKLSKILVHAAVDELAHIGELICLLWQLDVEPPYIEWLDYRL